MSKYNLIFWVAFFVWSFPLGIFRSRFRKMVYQTDSWLINIKPVFIKELRVLFGVELVEGEAAQKLVFFYRFYLTVYCLLLAGLLST